MGCDPSKKRVLGEAVNVLAQTLVGVLFVHDALWVRELHVKVDRNGGHNDHGEPHGIGLSLTQVFSQSKWKVPGPTVPSF
eukprot:5023730-Ditylum_brightwellii.AAC.1